MTRPSLPFAALAFLALQAPTTAAVADANGFGPLLGVWRGKGEIRLEGGKSEQIRCNAYYTQRDASGLGLAIRCASASYNIELRSNLQSQGGRITGNWEERTFNASGDVTGSATGNDIRLQVVGGGFSASMAVTTTGSSQSVSISTTGNQLQGVSIKLLKG